MRVIFVNRFYWPETPATAQLLSDLATGLAAGGASVTVITSRPRGEALPRRAVHEGVNVIRVATPRAGATTVPGKAAAFAVFWAGALWQIAREVRRGDILVTLTDPPLLGVASAAVGRMKGARIVHWIQDIYPEIAVALTGHRWLRMLAPLRSRAWRQADRCVTLGEDMAAHVRRHGINSEQIATIPNWPPAGVVRCAADERAVRALRVQWGLEDKFVVAYSGNLGRVHDLEPLLAAAAELVDQPRIVFLITGGGPQRAALEAFVHERRLDNVRFQPPQPRSQLSAALAVGDVHVVTLHPACASLVFPSKLYGIAAAGRPVIFIGPADAEVARLLSAHRFGYAFTRDQTNALATTLRRLTAAPDEIACLSAASVEFGAAHRAEIAIARWHSLLAEVEAC